MKHIRTLLLTSTLLAGPIAPALAQMSLSPEQQAQGARLRASIAQLDAQWRAQTGQSLLPAAQPGYPNQGQQPDPYQGQQDDQTTYQQFQAAMSQLGGVNPAALAGGAPGAYPQMAPSPYKRAPQPPNAGGGTNEFSPATIDGRDKIPVGYVADGIVTMTTNSDSPGPFRGMLTQPILSIDQNRVLFPQGSKIVGRVVRITGVNEAINARLGFVPTYLVRPDGAAMRIRQHNVLDQFGVNGVEDQVNYHVWLQLGAIAASTVVNTAPTVVGNLTAPNNQQSSSNSFSTGFLSTGSYAIQNQISRYLQVMPTVTVRARMPIKIFFNEEQFAPPIRERDNFKLTNINGPAPVTSQGRPR
jgi:type IV secretory pathway VirB10-like protein